MTWQEDCRLRTNSLSAGSLKAQILPRPEPAQQLRRTLQDIPGGPTRDVEGSKRSSQARVHHLSLPIQPDRRDGKEDKEHMNSRLNAALSLPHEQEALVSRQPTPEGKASQTTQKTIAPPHAL
jgi:hypothetical protein